MKYQHVSISRSYCEQERKMQGTTEISLVLSHETCNLLPQMLHCCIWGKLFVKLKFSSGSIVWELSTRVVIIVKAFCSILQVTTIIPQEWSQVWVRRGEEKQKETKRQMKQCRINEKVYDWENESIRMKESMEQNEGVKEMMTIHHCRYSQCITRWHEWLLSMSECCRPDPSISPDCSSHEWCCCFTALGATLASELAMDGPDRSDLPLGLGTYIANSSDWDEASR